MCDLILTGNTDIWMFQKWRFLMYTAKYVKQEFRNIPDVGIGPKLKYCLFPLSDSAF
jgi:hypothetical protein